MKRERKQVCFNSEYSISLRAVGINVTRTPPNMTTQEYMQKILHEFILSDKYLKNLYGEFVDEGFESELISDEEDKHLKQGIIYIELNAKGKVTFFPYG